MKKEIKYGFLGMMILAIAMFSVAQISATSYSSLNENLIAYYKLDEQTGTTTYDSLGLYNGTNSGANINQAGKINKSYLFSSDKVQVNSNLPALTNGTIGAWIKRSSLDDYSVIIGGNTNGAGLAIDSVSGTYYLNLRKRGVGQCMSTLSFDDTTNWHFVAVTFDGTNAKFYLDGSSDTISCTYSFSSVAYTIGQKSPDSTSEYFNGYIDELFFFNRKLSDAEVSEIYNSGSGLTYPFKIIYTNITINAVSSSNNASISIFNVTGSYEGETTNGSLETENQINGSLYNYVINAQGFTSKTYNNQNDSFIASLTPLGINGLNTTLTYGNKYVGETINITCDYVDNMGYGVNLTYFINNSDDGVSYNQTNGSYVIKGSDYQDTLKFWCIANNDYFENSTPIRTITGIDQIITFRAVNYLGNLISSVNFNFTDLGINYKGNPYTDFLSEFLSSTQSTSLVNTTIEDLTYYNQNYEGNITINESIGTYNITLQPNELVLEFFDRNKNPSDTKFEIADLNGVYANASSSVVIVQQGLSEGVIKVVFNQDNYGANWTQFYEYNNDYKTHVTEQITLLNDTADWVAYFEVLDYGNSPIKNAVIRAEYTTATAGIKSNYTLIGQRLTQQDGTTFFWFDSSTFVLITVTADGYNPVEEVLRIGDESAEEKSVSIPIYLEESSTGVESNMWVFLPKYVNNKSEDVEGYILNKNADQIKVTTDYRENLGLEQKELTSDGYGRYYFGLDAGTDFSTGVGDITVYIYVDGELVKTWIIEEKEITKIFEIPDLDKDIMLVAGAIALLVASAVAGAYFTSVTAGFTVFMVGGIFLSLLNGGFLWLAGIGIIYFLLKAIKKMISE